ncbi:MAG: FAD-binding protein, partial [Firmicutes bacterium]|nr:FAD-binding protein [Bacillota bacterium]
MSGKRIEWPYEIKYGQEKDVYADVVVLGGGLAGCYAAIGAARKGLKVALCDKSNVIHSGSGGTGIDHYSCPSNPACKLTIDEYMSTRGTYANYIAK